MKRLYRFPMPSANMGRLVPVLILATMLITMLPAFAPTGAGAQDGSEPTPVAEVQEEQQVEEETVEPTETAEPAETDEPQVQAGTTTYIAEARACPPGFDLSAGDASAALANCVEPLAGIAFTLGSQNPAYPGDTRTTGGDGVTAWSDIPLGTGYSIIESVPQGSNDPWVYCELTGGAGGDQYLFFPTSGGYMDVGLSDPSQTSAAQSYCRWFTVPAGDAGQALDASSGSVLVQGYVCAVEFYDPTKSLETYLDLCPTVHDGASVRLFSAESGADLTAQFAGSAQVAFPDVPPGETELNLLGGSSENRLFCATYPRGNAAPSTSAYAESPVTIDIEGNHETSCYWFNFQQLPDDAYVTITVEKYLCGPEYPDTTTIEDWRAACTDPHAGVTFTAEHVGGPIATETTGADGTLTFKLLPGDVNIQATPPDSESKGYAWCGVGAPGATPDYVNAGRLSAGEPNMPLSDINSELVYSCEWYTVPLEVTSDLTEDSGYVSILKWRCPEGYDATTATLEQLRDACSTPQPGVTIGIYYESGESFTQLTRLEKGPAIARFEGLPAGKVGIGEPGPNGHELTRAICSTGDIGQAGFGVIDAYMEYQIADGGIAATIESGKALDCHFFNVPVAGDDAPPTAGMVYVDSRICPPGFASVNSSYVDIAMYCSSEAGVEFKITQGETELVAITNESGLATFSDVPTGVFRIDAYPREGYDQPRVFCRFTLEGEGSTGNLDPVTVENWGVPSELKDGYFMECVWANMPAATTSVDPAGVRFQMHVCPEGTDAYASLDALLDTCSFGPEGVVFTAGQPLANPQEDATDASAAVAFSNMAPGFNQVNMVPKQGYKPLAAWCGYITPSGATAVARLTAEPLYLYLAGGHSVECGLYAVPYLEPEPIDIGINVSTCLPYYEFEVADLEYLSLNCTPEAGVDINVANDGGTYDLTVTTSVTGLAVFEQVLPKELTISENSDGHRTVRVFCGSAGTGFASVPFAEDAVEYVAKNDNVICYWFTIDTTYARLTIAKHACPEGYVADGQTYEAVLQACPAPLAGVRFDFDTSGTVYDITDDEGYAGFNDIDPGLQTMIETLPPDYSGATVFCRESTPGQPKPAFSQVPVENLTVEQPLEGGNWLECHWFNTKTTEATVVIHKYACHEGYIPQSNSYQAALSKCSTSLEGVTFTLGSPATELSSDTDAAGNVTFEAVAPGPVFISETPPSGYTDAVVYCAIHPAGGPQGQFEEVAVEQLAIEREVASGDTLECYWFNYAHTSEPTPSPTPSPTPIPVSTPTPGISTPTPDPAAPATLVLTTYLCPEAYDVYAADADLVEECEEASPGIEVSLANLEAESEGIVPVEIATTDEDGVATFTELEPGLWLLTEALPEDTATAFIASCESDQRDLDTEPLLTPMTYLGPDGQIGIVLVAGETLECDAYAIPEEVETE